MNPDEDDVLADWVRAGTEAPSGSGPGPYPSSTQFGAAEGRPHGRRRLVTLLVFTAAMWVVAAVLMQTDRARTAADAAGTPHPAPVPTPQLPTPGAAPPSVPELAASACAEMAVHEAVTRDDGGRWVDGAAVQRLSPVRAPVDTAASEQAVLAVVRAIVLTGDGTAWTGRVPTRYAVPLALDDDGCRTLATPWPLPVDDRPSPWTPSPVPGASPGDDGYAAALTAAGYRQVEIHAVTDPKRGLVVVDTEAVPPASSTREAVRVWLRAGPPARLLGL